MPQEELDDVDRLCEAYLSLLFAPEVALDVEEPLGREIVWEFLGYDRTEYLWRKIGEAEDANHVWSVHLQPLRKLLHVGERPAFEESCPLPRSGEHSEGIKGAEATAVATFLARTGKSKDEIREVILRDYYPIDFTLDEIRPGYGFDVSCQGSVPQALEAFFESDSFEDAIRNAISIGGDSDTIAAIAGAVAGAYYGIPNQIKAKASTFLDRQLSETLRAFKREFVS